MHAISIVVVIVIVIFEFSNICWKTSIYTCAWYVRFEQIRKIELIQGCMVEKKQWNRCMQAVWIHFSFLFEWFVWTNADRIACTKEIWFHPRYAMHFFHLRWTYSILYVGRWMHINYYWVEYSMHPYVDWRLWVMHKAMPALGSDFTTWFGFVGLHL